MKRLLPILLCLLLLGCGTEHPASEPTRNIPQIQTDPSAPEAEEPALTAFPLPRSDTQRVVMAGGDLLLFNTSDATTLTRISGDDLRQKACVTLDCGFFAGDPAVQISENGITYYDPYRCQLVFLSGDLKETHRIPAPAGITGIPALSRDLSSLYYFTDSALRELNLESGIDRLVKEMTFPYQTITALHCDGTVIECSVYDGYDNWTQLYLSASTGELLWETLDYVSLYTFGQRYFAVHPDGAYTELLTGLGDGPVKMLHHSDPDTVVFPVLECDGVITATDSDDGTVLDFFRLSDGTRRYSVTLDSSNIPFSYTWDENRGCIWFVQYDEETGTDLLYRWNPDASTVRDDTVYIGIRRTAENPDLDGLTQCQEFARELSGKHRVQILVWTDALEDSPWDYTLAPEHQVLLTRNALEKLDAVLSHFPEGVLPEAVSQMGDGTLRIHLVRGIFGLAHYDTLESAGGLQYWDDDFNAHICLQIGEFMEQNFFHEFFHVAESRIFSRSSAFDNWDALNPEGFSYAYHYEDYDFREEYHLISGPEQAFIDFYSMSYPKEDRARIMEYAVISGNEESFLSPTMQAKLLAICTGLRQAYDLQDYPKALIWEQYLTSPIHPET